MKNLKYYSSLLLILIGCNENIEVDEIIELEYSHYDIQLEIDPDGQFISVNGNLKLLIDKDSVSELSFTLHEQLVIENFGVDGDNSYQLDTTGEKIRWLPNAAQIFYRTNKPYERGEIVNVDFSYEGEITKWPSWSANVIGPDWIEMGFYFPWFPSFYGDYTYRVSVDIDPSYNVFAIGDVTKKGHKRIFETKYPVGDFIICASKDLTVRETELLNHTFQIVNCTLSEETVDTIQTDIQNFYQLYTKWFGYIEARDMCLVISKRDKGGGYSRKGGLFLGGVSDSSYLNDRVNYIRYVGHEISHFWWHGAESNWEDWLNESFAEYGAMMLIRELRVEEEFNTILNEKKIKSNKSPPIWDLPRNSTSAEVVLYSKGPVLLNELEEKIGKKNFLDLCKSRISKNIRNTSGFLNLLKDNEGKDIADWFERSLKQ
jgi:hypothetical protein